MLYKYGMRSKGFLIGCQPMNGLIEYEPDKAGKYYDILYYGRELTEQELCEYELDRLEKDW